MAGGVGNDTLFVGLGGNAQMGGGSGSDVSYGGLLSDILRGGEGSDYLYGNAGSDGFQFQTAGLRAGDSEIFYFVDAGDKLQFASSMQSALTFQDCTLSYDGNPLHVSACAYITAALGGGLTSTITVYGTDVAALMAMLEYTL
jgi:Ca2+-binding RTX toxin-like protein